MGKKVSPHSFRIGITRSWDSKWFAKRDYKEKFLQDLQIREYLTKKLAPAGISRIELHRKSDKITAVIYTAKPGIIVGRGGENIGKLQKELKQKFNEIFDISVQEVRKPDGDAQLIANNIAEQISRRFPHRRVMKMAIEKAKESGIKGIRVMVSGRLNGVDIARKEVYSHGTVPLHTLRANIDYATAGAPTNYGMTGVKVWTYHGLVFRNEALND